MQLGWYAEHAWEIWLLLGDDLQHLPQLVPINGGNEDAELALLIKGHVPVSAGRTRVGANLNALCHVMQLSTQLVELFSVDTIPLFLLQVHVLSWLVHRDSIKCYQNLPVHTMVPCFNSAVQSQVQGTCVESYQW